MASSITAGSPTEGLHLRDVVILQWHRSLSSSVGFALEDFSTLRYIRDLAEEQAIERRVDLLPPMGIDPKDLYGLVMGPPGVRSLGHP